MMTASDSDPVLITRAPVRGDDPRVYTDPYPGARGKDLVKLPCAACGGDGLYHAPSGYVLQDPYGKPGETIKGCFDCRGLGHRIVTVASQRTSARREVKALLRRDAAAAEFTATADERAAAELAAAWDEALIENARRDALNNTPAGEPGQRLAGLTGVITVSKSTEAPGFRYGTTVKRLVVITLDSGQVIKTFGSGGALFATRRCDRVTITAATVKAHEMWEGQLQTVVTRLALRIDVPVPRAEDINPGDLVEHAGDWHRVYEVGDWSVAVTDLKGTNAHRIAYHELTGHRADKVPAADR